MACAACVCLMSVGYSRRKTAKCASGKADIHSVNSDTPACVHTWLVKRMKLVKFDHTHLDSCSKLCALGGLNGAFKSYGHILEYSHVLTQVSEHSIIIFQVRGNRSMNNAVSIVESD